MLADLVCSRRDVNRATEDITRSLQDWRIWFSLAWFDVQQYYRRSVLGPFWFTISTCVVVLVMAVVMGGLFGSPIKRYLPFITISLMLWNLTNSMVQGGSQCYISAGPTILQFERPLTAYYLKLVFYEIIVFAHVIGVFFVVALIFGIRPGMNTLIGLLALPIFLLNIAWMGLFSAIFAARFRDVPPMLQNLFTALFWLSPILYRPSQMPETLQIFLQFNPLTHLLAIVRDPLLNQPINPWNWVVALTLLVLGWALTFAVFARFRGRVAYWL